MEDILLSFRFLRVLAVFVCCSISSAEEIPLDQIWAYNMPGTRDIKELEKDQEPPDETTTDIRHKTLATHALYLLASNRPLDGKLAKPGFVVVGNGYEALEEAQAVFSKKKKRKDVLPSGEVLTLVFFTHSCPRYVWIDEVNCKDNRIVIKYHFHAHGNRSSRANLALIPLGKFAMGELPLRKIQVEFERLPDTSIHENVAPMDKARASQTVCDSFTFGVME